MKRLRRNLRRVPRRVLVLIGVAVVAGVIAIAVWWRGGSTSNDIIRQYLRNPGLRAALSNTALAQCPDAPFVLPSSGLIGLLWGDPAAPYTRLRRHTGIDIFGDGAPGTVPIYAAYDGYLTRLPEWLSTVIIRHDDPLRSGRVIWTYYTHMASRDGEQSYIAFPRGTWERFVRQGTLLGYQGEYAGTGAPIAMHLHFSIVASNDEGGFLSETVLGNTLDPSPYFGLPLEISDNPPRPVTCG